MPSSGPPGGRGPQFENHCVRVHFYYSCTCEVQSCQGQECLDIVQGKFDHHKADQRPTAKTQTHTNILQSTHVYDTQNMYSSAHRTNVFHQTPKWLVNLNIVLKGSFSSKISLPHPWKCKFKNKLIHEIQAECIPAQIIHKIHYDK